MSKGNRIRKERDKRNYRHTHIPIPESASSMFSLDNQRTIDCKGKMGQRYIGHTLINGIDEPDKNEMGYAMVDLGEIPYGILGSRKTLTMGELKEINDQRITTPNGNQIPYGRGFKDEWFEGKDMSSKIVVLNSMCQLTNSSYYLLNEEDGFTDEILNDVEEMKKYLFWVVRITTSKGVVDCPLDVYSKYFTPNEEHQTMLSDFKEKCFKEVSHGDAMELIKEGKVAFI